MSVDARDPIDEVSGLVLYGPLGVPKQFASDVWIVDDGVVWMDFPGFRVPFPTRMTIVRLATGELFVVSPTEPRDDVCEAVSRLGRVAHLVSSNFIHYAHIAAWKRRFPDAIAWASPGVRERAAKHGVDVTFDHDLGEAPDARYASEIDQLIVRGSPVMREVVFFHRASKTLVLTDLIENFERERVTKPFWRALLRLSGAMDPDGKAPLDMRMTFARGRDLARASVERMIAWGPERIIVAHGRCYTARAVDELYRAFRFTGVSR